MWRNKKPLFLILPSLLITLLLFFGGLWEGLLQSIGWNTVLRKGQITGHYYIQVLYSSDFWDALMLTLRVSFIATVLATFIAMGVIFTIFMMRSKDSKIDLLLQRIFQVPMLFPYMVAAYILYLMLSPSGWIARILYNMGWMKGMEQFPIIVHDGFGWGIIFAYVWKTSPFIVLMLYPVLLKVEKSWVEVGRVLGANKGQFFRDVVFPMLAGPLRMASFIVFSYSFLAYEIPYLLGVTYPKMLSVGSYQLYMNGALAERPKALAINIISTAIVALLGFLFYYLTKEKREG